MMPIRISAKRGNKDNARKVVIDGLTFDSAAEGNRYCELLLLVRAGHIKYLTLQPKFPIEVNGHKICTYIADFMYETRGGEEVVEDVKGMRTALFSIKKKLVEATHGIKLVLVTATGAR